MLASGSAEHDATISGAEHDTTITNPEHYIAHMYVLRWCAVVRSMCTRLATVRAYPARWITVESQLCKNKRLGTQSLSWIDQMR
jgi:hypothetical protein